MLRTVLLLATLAVVASAEAAVKMVKLDNHDTKIGIVKEGAADAPVIMKGDTVTVHATGTVKGTGKQFWSTKDKNEPFTYPAGIGRVIKGWDQGCLGARIGETRRIDIPAHEGYGENGFPAWGIPPHGGLIFDIEVLEIKKPHGEL